MSIFFKNHEIVIYRSRKKSGADRYAYSATFTGYSADIQPASQERTEFAQGRFGKTFTAFVEANIDIKEGDEIRTEDGKVYSVKGVSSWSGSGILDHQELLLTSQDA